MRLVAWILTGLGVVTLQVTVVPLLAWQGIRPDLVLAFVVLQAVFGKGWVVVFSAWVLGLAVDLLTVERMGLASFSYLLAALVVVRLSSFVPVKHPLIFTVLVFVIVFAVQALWVLYRSLPNVFLSQTPQRMVYAGAGAALYTALIACFMYYAVRPWGSVLGLRFPRYARHRS